MKVPYNKLSIGCLGGCVVVLLWLTSFQAGVIAKQHDALDGITKAPCGFFVQPRKGAEPAPTMHVLPKRI